MRPLPKTAVDHCAREALANENIAEIVRVLTNNIRVGSCARRDDNEGIVTFLVRLNGDLSTPLQNLTVISYPGVHPAGLDCQMIIESTHGTLKRIPAKVQVLSPVERYLLTEQQRSELKPDCGIGFIHYNPNYEQTEISLFFLEETANWDQLAAGEMIVAPPPPGSPVRLYLPRYFS